LACVSGHCRRVTPWALEGGGAPTVNRMLHLRRPWLSLEDLKKLVAGA
jgi:hypothetical protein